MCYEKNVEILRNFDAFALFVKYIRMKKIVSLQPKNIKKL